MGCIQITCMQSFSKCLSHSLQCPSPWWFTWTSRAKHALQSLMLPHELFSALYHYYPSTFQKHFTPGGHEQVSKFWSKFAQHPSMEGHEIFALKNYKHRALPLNLHGDGVPITGKGKVWVKMMLTLSWTGCLAEGSSKDTCNLIWGVPWKELILPHLYQCVSKPATWESYLRVIAKLFERNWSYLRKKITLLGFSAFNT